MEFQNKNDNAANRKSYVGYIYNQGEQKQKATILSKLDLKWAKLHNCGYIHIHDLDAYGLTYNCLTFDILNAFPYEAFKGISNEETIIGIFDFIKELIAKMGNEQSGGMSFANFDIDFAKIFNTIGVDFHGKETLFHAAIKSLIIWCNNMHTRMGQTSYYVTFCLGLGTDDFSRFLTKTFLQQFYDSSDLIYKPNIVFKVHQGINRFPTDPNFDLLKQSLLCTAKKMIPTYLLCDCELNKEVNPYNLSIVGCRTRVVSNIYENKGSIGRGNIANITINLPRLALETIYEIPNESITNKITLFYDKWLNIASITKDILIDRYKRTCQSDISLFPTNKKYKLWCENINEKSLEETFKHGTLSIGFIGLSEVIEILLQKQYYQDTKAYQTAIDIVKFMREYTDKLTTQYQLNFSLLATSGELISGRFIEIDKKIYLHPCLAKNFYTNSFHINVDSELPAYKKIELEGKFHNYTNGGSITYVELKEAPLGNDEGLDELIEIAIKSGVHYLGFNFPKDICNSCACTGTFDNCPICGSTEITRIRRVSGYLEIEDYFTFGKKHEVKLRKEN